MDTNRPKAYSYVRFSSAEQAQGDSLRRQTEAATTYAEAHGLDLDTDLTFRDLGVSAYREKNVNDGALGQFIAAADSGKIAPGSFLLVEDLDRLSRAEPLVAMNRLADLVGRGIRVVTLNDGQEHNAESLTRLDGLIVPLVKASLAHEESAKKAKRLREVWKQKKARAAANGEILTAMVPAWLRVRDGEFEVNKRRAKVVKRIFDMAAAGHGKSAIARTLNVEGIATFGKSDGWHASYILKILRNPAVIGTFQPHKITHVDGKKKRVPHGEPIPGYFPEVIEPSLFYQVKHSRPGPSGKGNHLQRNLLSGLAFCARCGGKMSYANKGRGHQYLICDKARRFGKCDAPAVPYFDVFGAVMLALDDFRPFEVDGNAVQEREREIDALAGQIAECQETIGRFVDSLGRVSSPTMEQHLIDEEATLAALKTQRAALQEKGAARVDLSRPLDLDLDDDPVMEYILFEGDRPVPKDKVEAVRAGRAHIAAEIRRVVERVEVIKGESVKIIPKG